MERRKETGFKLTPQRLAILAYLDGNTNHPAAEDIYRDVRKSFPTMSFATVYNTLEALKRRGEIIELTIDPERKHYDPNTDPHHHLICLSCKRIVDVHKDFKINIPRAQRQGFRVTGNHIEFYGVCPDCMKKGGVDMAVFKCEECGATKEGRCKPKKCSKCGASGTMKKEG
ncbi:MAG: transcriptional repressor [Nitrospirae bacterium]|nr:transcriptional repressor [Nitrospirota bacterium]